MYFTRGIIKKKNEIPGTQATAELFSRERVVFSDLYTFVRLVFTNATTEPNRVDEERNGIIFQLAPEKEILLYFSQKKKQKTVRPGDC